MGINREKVYQVAKKEFQERNGIEGDLQLVAFLERSGMDMGDFREIIIDEKKCTPPPGWNEGGENDENDGDDVDAGSWAVTGTLVYQDGKPGTSLMVDLISKESNESLVKTNSSRAGKFKLELHTDKFADVFRKKTKLGVIVSTRDGRRLYVSRQLLQAEVGGEKKLDIKLKRSD